MLKYFDYSEFDSPDIEGSGKKYMNQRFLDKLDVARGIAGIPFIINSGYRSIEHNLAVGGIKNSSHLKGLAADIECDTDEDRYKITQALLKAGINRIGIKGSNGFIHCDIDPSKNKNRIWAY